MSAINTGSINVNYPTPGVNNNSQGFRNNFTGIKNNLDIAGTEIGELQTKALLKSALTGITLDNDMANTQISNALTLNFRGTTFNLGNNLSGAITVNAANGDLQYGTLTGNISLGFSGWAPSGTASKIELLLSSPTPDYQILLPSGVVIGTSTLETYTVSGPTGYIRILGGSLGLESPSVLHLIFTTKDCGTTVEVNCVNRPRRATRLVTTVPTSSLGANGDVAGLVAVDTNYMYVCCGTWDGVTDIWKRVTLYGGSW